MFTRIQAKLHKERSSSRTPKLMLSLFPYFHFMALSVSHHPLLHGHGNKISFALQSQGIPSSKANTHTNTNTYLLQFPSIQCCSSSNDSKTSSIKLRTCKNCKAQFDPALNHPLACRFHTAHFGGMVAPN